VSTERRQVHGAGYQRADEGYLDKRQLRSGAAGWVLLAGLGVAYVISGDFARWNFGLAEGGWGGAC
jgi:ethanolamine permease